MYVYIYIYTYIHTYLFICVCVLSAQAGSETMRRKSKHMSTTNQPGTRRPSSQTQTRSAEKSSHSGRTLPPPPPPPSPPPPSIPIPKLPNLHVKNTSSASKLSNSRPLAGSSGSPTPQIFPSRKRRRRPARHGNTSNEPQHGPAEGSRIYMRGFIGLRRC